MVFPKVTYEKCRVFKICVPTALAPYERMNRIQNLDCYVQCSMGHAPFTELFTELVPKCTFRSSDTMADCYNIPFNECKTFGNRGFKTVGPR